MKLVQHRVQIPCEVMLLLAWVDHLLQQLRFQLCLLAERRFGSWFLSFLHSRRPRPCFLQEVPQLSCAWQKPAVCRIPDRAGSDFHLLPLCCANSCYTVQLFLPGRVLLLENACLGQGGPEVAGSNFADLVDSTGEAAGFTVQATYLCWVLSCRRRLDRILFAITAGGCENRYESNRRNCKCCMAVLVACTRPWLLCFSKAGDQAPRVLIGFQAAGEAFKEAFFCWTTRA